MKDVLQRLTALWGPPGQEEAVADVIADLMAPLVDRVERDALGNLICSRAGTAAGSRVMLTAHMDQPGLMVSHIDEQGFCRVAPVGPFSVATGKGQRVQFAGAAGVLEHEPVEAVKELTEDKVFVDIGAADAAAARQRVQVGDVCTYAAPLLDLGSRVVGTALDGRAGCAIVIEAARRLQTAGGPHHLHFVFSVQGQVGGRGARTAAFALRPDCALVVGTVAAGDLPGADPSDLALGKGAVIKIKDKRFVADQRLRQWLAAAAAEQGIAHQFQANQGDDVNITGIQTAQSGVATAAVGVAVRYRHSAAEMVDLTDMAAAAALLSAALAGPLPD